MNKSWLTATSLVHSVRQINLALLSHSGLANLTSAKIQGDEDVLTYCFHPLLQKGCCCIHIPTQSER